MNALTPDLVRLIHQIADDRVALRLPAGGPTSRLVRGRVWSQSGRRATLTLDGDPVLVQAIVPALAGEPLVAGDIVECEQRSDGRVTVQRILGRTGATTGAVPAPTEEQVGYHLVVGEDLALGWVEDEGGGEHDHDADYEPLGAVATHEADTTSVHGIADTSSLYRGGGTDVAVADGGTGASDASGARTNLGLVIGTNVQAHDGDLDAIAALSTTSFGRALLELADAAALRTATGLIGFGTLSFATLTLPASGTQNIGPDTMSAVTLSPRAPWAGTIIGISVNLSSARTGGTCTFQADNGGGTAIGPTATIGASNTVTHSATAAIGEAGSTFTANTRFRVVATGTGTFAPTTADAIITLFLAFHS